MELTHLPLSQLEVSRLNMRHGRKAPDITDILPSVRARGVLTPLLVRANGGEGQFEIVAGRRRYYAALAVAAENGEVEPLPCAIMAADDDAAALEASLIENLARLDPDEVTQWITFTRLVKEGRGASEIAATFGLTELQVKRVLALGNLLPRIRELYRQQIIDAASIRHLTLASRERQAEWLALYRDPEARTPTGQQLKHWLFGGQSIPTRHARFDLADYPQPIVTDLFGDDSYFSDADSFWTLQRAAIERLRQQYLGEGWTKVTLLEPGEHFHRWEHEKTGKAKGGRVYITLSRQGEVEVHDGWLTMKEAHKRRRAEQPGEPSAPNRREKTANLQAYVDLHRQAAVRAELTKHPDMAVRLLAAHAIAGSWLWSVKPDPQRAPTDAIAASLAASVAETQFAERRREVLAMLGCDAAQTCLTGAVDETVAELFTRLLALSDAELFAIIAVIMGETLAVGSPVVDEVGTHLAVDMGRYWQADTAFLDLLRQRSLLTAMVEEVAGPAVAGGNAQAKAKTLRGILGDCLSGSGGRTKVEGWLPRWLRFPATSYFGSLDAEPTDA